MPYISQVVSHGRLYLGKKNKRKGPVKQNKKMLNRLGKAKDHEKFREKIATRISNACKVLHVKPVVSKKYGIPIG